jgi:hypothetical protein
MSQGYPLILILLAQRVGADPLGIGLIFAGGGTGSIVGALIGAQLQKRFRLGQILIPATWGWSLGWLLYLVAPDPLTLGLANVLGFIVVPIYLVTQFSYRLAATPDHLQGRVHSVFRLVAFGGQPISLAIAGFLLEVFGPVTTVFIIVVPQILLSIAATANGHLRRAPLVAEAGRTVEGGRG